MVNPGQMPVHALGGGQRVQVEQHFPGVAVGAVVVGANAAVHPARMRRALQKVVPPAGMRLDKGHALIVAQMLQHFVGQRGKARVGVQLGGGARLLLGAPGAGGGGIVFQPEVGVGVHERARKNQNGRIVPREIQAQKNPPGRAGGASIRGWVHFCSARRPPPIRVQTREG